MKNTHVRGNKIEGELDIFFANSGDPDSGEILIHGDPEGLRSFARLLIEIAELNQEEVDNKLLPVNGREHYHLRPNIELSKSSVEVIVGRLDAKGTGNFYDRFVPKDKIKRG